MLIISQRTPTPTKTLSLIPLSLSFISIFVKKSLHSCWKPTTIAARPSRVGRQATTHSGHNAVSGHYTQLLLGIRCSRRSVGRMLMNLWCYCHRCVLVVYLRQFFFFRSVAQPEFWVIFVLGGIDGVVGDGCEIVLVLVLMLMLIVQCWWLC